MVSFQKREIINMAKKGVVKQMDGKVVKANKPGKSVRRLSFLILPV